MILPEGSLRFSFGDDYKVIKFDETTFYRRYFNNLPYSKGLDFIADSARDILLIEVKNCKGNEERNRWRTIIDHKKVISPDGTTDDSFDTEIAQKVAMSISCLVGANTKSGFTDTASVLVPYFMGITDNKIASERKKAKVIFFLEGDFGSGTRTKRMIMQRIQESVGKKLRWLNCSVQVVDSATVNDRYFSVEAITQ